MTQRVKDYYDAMRYKRSLQDVPSWETASFKETGRGYKKIKSKIRG